LVIGATVVLSGNPIAIVVLLVGVGPCHYGPRASPSTAFHSRCRSQGECLDLDGCGAHVGDRQGRLRPRFHHTPNGSLMPVKALGASNPTSVNSPPNVHPMARQALA
jgi:hypothetical protein